MTNITTLQFGTRRDPETEQQQIELLTKRVLGEIYQDRFGRMLSDMRHDTCKGECPNLKQWLQEKLEAVQIIRPVRILKK